MFSVLPSINGYTVVREVGSGSFGKAYLVYKNNDRERTPLCLKIISIARMGEKERREAMKEAKLLSTLRHPYIVSFRESWCESGNLYIVMDYAEKGDIQQKILAQKKLGKHFLESQIIRWLTQALLALKYLHERHIIHRDIKSSNFFLTADGRIRVGDFGIAKELNNTCSLAKTTVGTPYYLSPEICLEQSYNQSSDIWSLGIFLYELCTLRVPFDAANIRLLVDKIVHTNPPDIPDIYSPELNQILMMLLRKDQTLRPTASNLLAHNIIQREIREMLLEEQIKKNNEENRRLNEQKKLDNVKKYKNDIKNIQSKNYPSVYSPLPMPIRKKNEQRVESKNIVDDVACERNKQVNKLLVADERSQLPPPIPIFPAHLPKELYKNNERKKEYNSPVKKKLEQKELISGERDIVKKKKVDNPPLIINGLKKNEKNFFRNKFEKFIKINNEAK